MTKVKVLTVERPTAPVKVETEKAEAPPTTNPHKFLKKWMPKVVASNSAYTPTERAMLATELVHDVRSLVEAVRAEIKMHIIEVDQTDKTITVTVGKLIEQGKWSDACRVLGMQPASAGGELPLYYPIAMSFEEAQEIDLL